MDSELLVAMLVFSLASNILDGQLHQCSLLSEETYSSFGNQFLKSQDNFITKPLSIVGERLSFMDYYVIIEQNMRKTYFLS